MTMLEKNDTHTVRIKIDPEESVNSREILELIDEVIERAGL